MHEIESIGVLRISKSSINTARFRIFSDGIRDYCILNNLDREDIHTKLEEDLSQKKFQSFLSNSVDWLLEDGISAIIVGVPGPVFRKEVFYCSTIPYLQGNFLLKVIESKNTKNIPVLLVNNTNAWLIAELRQGVLGRSDSALLLSLGSGIGGAISFAGRSFVGDSGLAGEIGHTVHAPHGPVCKCGRKGCLERFASGDAIKWLAGEQSIIVEQPSDLANIPEAKSIIDSAVEALALAIYRTVHTFDIHKICIGGSLVGSIHHPDRIQNILHDLDHHKRFSVLTCQNTAIAGSLVGLAYMGFDYVNQTVRNKLRSDIVY